MVYLHVMHSALTLHNKNKQLFQHLYGLVILTFTILVVWHAFGVVPTVLEISKRATLGLDITGDVIKLALIGGFFFLFAFIAVIKLTLNATYVAVSTYLDEQLDFKGLIEKAKANWKGPLITLLLAYVVVFIYAIVLGGLIFLARYLGAHSWVWAVLFWILAVLFFLKYLFTWLVVAVAVVVSVADPGVQGIAAIKAAWTLVESKKHGSFFVALSIFVLDVLYKLIYSWALHAGWLHGQVVLAIILGIIFILIEAGFFIFVVNSVTILFFATKAERPYAVLAAEP